MIYCFSGKIASGKTSIAKSLASEKGIKYISFSAYLKNYAISSGLDPNDRQTLQNLGEKFIKSDIQNFCVNVLNQINWEDQNSFVVDGIRHLEVFSILKELLLDKKILLVYLDTVLNTRLKRLDINRKILTKFESHSTEKQVEAIIKDNADIVIDGSLDIKVIVKKILSH